MEDDNDGDNNDDNNDDSKQKLQNFHRKNGCQEIAVCNVNGQYWV